MSSQIWRTYTHVGDYKLPNLTIGEVPAEEREAQLGRFAHIRRAYLREHRPILNSQLVLTVKLWEHLREIDQAAQSRLDLGMSESEIVRELVCD